MCPSTKNSGHNIQQIILLLRLFLFTNKRKFVKIVKIHLSGENQIACN